MLTPETKAFLLERAHDDPDALALQAARYPELPIPFIAQQLKGRRKAGRKLPSWAANQDIVFPVSLALEQCTSEAVAAFKAALFSGSRAADLTGGFGIDASFLARRFERLAYVERNAELAAIAAWNFSQLGLDQKVNTHVGDGIEWLRAHPEPLDLIYLDPARRDARGLKVSAFQACEPDAVAHRELLRQKARVVAIKGSPGLDLDFAIAQLSPMAEVYVIASQNECKELLFVIRSGHSDEPEIHCVELGGSAPPIVFTFRISSEKALLGQFSAPARYLYEPSPSILKAGAFKSYAAAHGLPALHPRTRLYTSDQRIDSFSGRVFEIHGQGPLNAKAARSLFPEGQANTLACNCGLTSDALKRQLKLRDGGEAFAIGAMVTGGKRGLFRCRRVD